MKARNIRRNIVCTLGILVLILLIKPTKVFAFSENDAKKSPVLVSGKYETASLSDDNNIKLYQIKITNTGYFTITLRPDASADINNIRSGWDVEVYDDSNLSDPIKRYYSIKGIMTTDKLVLEKGVYYVAVSPSLYTPEIEFNIKADIVYDNSWEQENNNTFGRANIISVGKKYHGTLCDKYDKDWFKITAPDTGKITVTLKSDSDIDVDDIGRGWDIRIYSAKNLDEKMTNKYDIKTNGSITFDVTKGMTYYINIDNGFSDSIVDCVYNLSASFSGTKKVTKKNITIKKVTGVSLKVKDKKIYINFKKVTEASKYQIMYSTNNYFKNYKIVTVKSNKYTLKKLKTKKTYFVKVRAIGKNGKAGAWSAVKKAKIK